MSSTYYVLREVHEGINKNHSEARPLVRKAVFREYFWPQMERDALTFTRKYDKCQRFTLVSHFSHTEMVPMPSPWSFIQWDIDILGSQPEAPLQKKFFIVAIDYFKKSIKV